MYKSIIKRFIDVVISIVILVIISPVLIMTSILVKLTSKGPILFLQKRLGKGGEQFTIFKFRTMTNEKRVPSKEIYGNEMGVTKVGYWLRKLKIDELPQLFCVLKGDMSLVGPRPGLPQQLKEYSELAKERLKVKPGLTGYAQVNGNIYLSWEDRWIYDKYYVDNISFTFDFKIVVKTIFVVILGEKKFKKDAKNNFYR